jgi:hypothetical protein
LSPGPLRFRADVQQSVEELSILACVELFEAYGTKLERIDANVDNVTLMYCGVGGFLGRELRGVCLLATTEQPLAQSDRVGGEPRDWAGELTNQLIGRIKNKLAAHGTKVLVNIPVVVQGKHIAPLPRRELVPICFRASDGYVFLWVDTEASSTLALARVRDSEVPIAEGDTLLF